jgi:hypothetical protein
MTHDDRTSELDTMDRHAGKAADDRHPVREGEGQDTSDVSDPRVAQPGEDPPGEDALGAGRGR